ncbi:MAG: hypothetical protein IJF46_03595 [Bacteroidaceae bacterium]|nr:hypothetical protein [Bacteroidaceae bacterium]
MLRALLLAIFVLIVACGTDDTPSGSVVHRHFVADEPRLHTRRGMLGRLPFASDGGTVGGAVHIVAADYRPSDSRRLMLDAHGRHSPLTVEAQLSPDDSLTLHIRFSYTVQDDSVCEVVSGTLYVPILGDTAVLHNDLRRAPLYEPPHKGNASETLILGLDFLPL